MRSPTKVATIQATILNFLTKQKPLEPSGSPTEASIPPDLALGGTAIEEGGTTEIEVEKSTMEMEALELEHDGGITLMENVRSIGNEANITLTSFNYADWVIFDPSTSPKRKVI